MVNSGIKNQIRKDIEKILNIKFTSEQNKQISTAIQKRIKEREVKQT